MKKPNFFIIGAPKCGTTAMSEYLKTHPDIFMSTPKEPHFFAKDMKGYECCDNLEEYLRLFENVNKEKIIGEASVLYLYSDTAIQNIKRFNPKAKILVMLRNPVDMIYSYHNQLVLNADENILDFRKAWNLEKERRKGKYISSTCRNRKLLYYRDVGKFGKQIEKLYKYFPKSQIHLIIFEDFKENPLEEYKKLLNFLDVEYDGRKDFPKINENKKIRLKLLAKLRNHPPRKILKVVRRIKTLLGIENVHIMEKIYKMNQIKQKRDPLDIEFKQEILNEFIEDICLLEKLIGKNLYKWKTI